MNNLVHKNFEARRHGLLPAKLSQHLERSGRFWVNIAEVVSVSFHLTIAFLIKSGAEHQDSVVRQHMVLENFRKGKQAGL